MEGTGFTELKGKLRIPVRAKGNGSTHSWTQQVRTRTPTRKFCMGSDIRVDLENTLDRFVEERFFLVVSIDWIRNLQLVSQSTEVITCPLDT